MIAHGRRDVWRRLVRRIDRWLEGGDSRAIILLAGLAIAVAVLSAVVALVFHAQLFDGSGVHELGPVDGFWQALVRTIDPGQITADHGSGRTIGLVTTVFGLLLLSTLISLVGNVVERRVERARRGRDPVEFRRGHDDVPYHVVLGWSELTLPLLGQLAHSHTGQLRPDVLVLAPRPATDMRQQIDEYLEQEHRNQRTKASDLPHKPRHWPELRTGNPTDDRDLIRIARLERATSVIVLAPDPERGDVSGLGGPDDLCPASAEVVKVAVAVSAAAATQPEAQPEQSTTSTSALPLRLVVEVPGSARTDRNLGARLTQRLPGPPSVGRPILVLPVDVARLHTHLAARVSRQAGLTSVYRELLDFQGCEFHVLPRRDHADGAPRVRGDVEGLQFGQVAEGIADGIVVGVVDDGPDRQGFRIPPWTEVPDTDERFVVLSERADSATMPPPNDAIVAFGSIPLHTATPEEESVLVLGWNHRGPGLIEALQAQLPDGSTITVVGDHTDIPIDEAGTVKVEHQNAPGGFQEWLDQPDNAGLLKCDHVLVLGDDDVSPAVSDAGVLLTLLALSSGSRIARRTTVVAELRERPNRRLARRRFNDDLVVGDSLIACVLAQYAATPALTDVFAALIEHACDPAFEFRFLRVPEPFGAANGQAATFRDLQRWCWQRGFIALGYRANGEPPVLNPNLDQPVGWPASCVTSKLEAVVVTKLPRSPGEVATAPGSRRLGPDAKTHSAP